MTDKYFEKYIKETDSITLSKEADEAIYNDLLEACKAQKGDYIMTYKKKRTMRIGLIAAALVAVLAATAFAAINAHIEMKRTDYGQTTEIDFAKTDDANLELGFYYPECIPDGYTKVFVSEYDNRMQTVVYENPQGAELRYIYETAGEGGQVSFENIRSEETVDINGSSGTLYTLSDSSRILLWTNDAAGIGFTLTATDKDIDLIKLAASVAPSDKPMQAKDMRSR